MAELEAMAAAAATTTDGPLAGLFGKLLSAFEEEGMLVVEGLDGYEESRLHALAELGSCTEAFHQEHRGAAEEEEGDDALFRASRFAGGVTRSSLATSSKGSTGAAFEAAVEARCPHFAQFAATLRRATSEAAAALAKSLQSALESDRGSRGEEETAAVDLLAAVETGEHLEHFHVYRHDNAGNDDGEAASPMPQRPSRMGASVAEEEHHLGQEIRRGERPSTLDMHTDMGVLLAMTRALYTTPGGGILDKPSGLFVETAAGEVMEVALPEDGLLFLLGEGINLWIDHGTEEGRPSFHVPKHAMAMPKEEGKIGGGSGVARAWYGRMVLPPDHARLQVAEEAPNPTIGGDGDGDTGVRYGAFREMARRKLEGSPLQEGDEALAEALKGVGCSHGRSLKEGLAVQGNGGEQGSTCGKDEIYCWMQCMPTQSLNCSAADAQCSDSQGRIWKKETGEMCPDCQLRCKEKPPPPSESKNRVCNPDFTPVSMYMSGFQFGYRSDDPCLVFLFSSLVLDKEWKFAVACIVTVALAVLCDYCNVCRQTIRGRISRSGSGMAGRWWEISEVAVFTFQAALSYALMLVAMTYKGELFLSLLIGLGVGYVSFKRREPAQSPELCCGITLSPEAKKEEGQKDQSERKSSPARNEPGNDDGDEDANSLLLSDGEMGVMHRSSSENGAL